MNDGRPRVTREASQLDYQSLFEQAPGAFLVLLPDAPVYTTIAANDDRLAVTMSTREGPNSFIGRGVFEAFPDPPDDPSATGTRNLRASLDTVMRTKAAHQMAVQRYDIQSPDGVWQRRYWEPLNRPVLGSDGEVKYIVHYAMDVTDRELERATASAERAARVEAEGANHAKMEFLAAMSHELRTPLNAIAGYVDLLDLGIHGPITESQKATLARISKNQRHLLGLINDILSFAKLEAGHVRMEAKILSAREILESLDPLISPQAQARGIAYSVQVCDPGMKVVADPERIRQILLNLLGNAVKFTQKEGWVLLACDPVEDQVRFKVQDNGPGIPAEMHDAIFSPFVQIGRKLANPQEGVGLGLAISRDLARAMGGELTVESEPGRGSTFYVTLPKAGD